MDPFIGQIKCLAITYAPEGYMHCNGGIYPIAQFSALFSLLGFRFGGDGRTTFGVPNLQGRAAVHKGVIGNFDADFAQEHGAPTQTLPPWGVPAHTHRVVASIDNGTPNVAVPEGNVPAQVNAGLPPVRANYATSVTNQRTFNPLMLQTTEGARAPFNNMSPYLVLTYAIASEGVYPSRD